MDDDDGGVRYSLSEMSVDGFVCVFSPGGTVIGSVSRAKLRWKSLHSRSVIPFVASGKVGVLLGFAWGEKIGLDMRVPSFFFRVMDGDLCVVVFLLFDLLKKGKLLLGKITRNKMSATSGDSPPPNPNQNNNNGDKKDKPKKHKNNPNNTNNVNNGNAAPVQVDLRQSLTELSHLLNLNFGSIFATLAEIRNDVAALRSQQQAQQPSSSTFYNGNSNFQFILNKFFKLNNFLIY